jgi:hypothetical protein
MASGEQADRAPFGSTAIATEAARMSVRANASAFAGSMKSPYRDSLIRSCKPLRSCCTFGRPISPIGSEVSETEYDDHFQPARCNASMSLLTKPYSAAGSLSIVKSTPAYVTIFSMSFCAFSSLISRGVIFLFNRASSSCASASLSSVIDCNLFCALAAFPLKWISEYTPRATNESAITGAQFSRAVAPAGKFNARIISITSPTTTAHAPQCARASLRSTSPFNWDLYTCLT